MFGHKKTLLFVLERPFTLICLFTSPDNPHKTKCFFPIRLWLNAGRLGCFLLSRTHLSSWEQWKWRNSLTGAFPLHSSIIRATGLKPLSRHLIYRQRRKNNSTKKASPYCSSQVITAVIQTTSWDRWRLHALVITHLDIFPFLCCVSHIPAVSSLRALLLHAAATLPIQKGRDDFQKANPEPLGYADSIWM